MRDLFPFVAFYHFKKRPIWLNLPHIFGMWSVGLSKKRRKMRDLISVSIKDMTKAKQTDNKTLDVLNKYHLQYSWTVIALGF